MQVKKFEAPTMQEALENVKRELGPEAIILQTKKNKRGFGLLSKSSVEITAAVSDRSIQKKQITESRLPEANKTTMKNLPAQRQADLIDKYVDRNVARNYEKSNRAQEQVEVSRKGPKITATRYIDIQDDLVNKRPSERIVNPGVEAILPAIASPGSSLSGGLLPKVSLEDEVKLLRKMLEDLQKNEAALQTTRNWKGLAAESLLKQTALDTPVLQDAFEQLVVNGVDRRYAYSLIKKVAFELGPDLSKRSEQVFELLANEIMETVEVASPLGGIQPDRARQGGYPVLIALVGPTGVGKTMTLAKLASEAVNKRNLKVGMINLDTYKISAFEQLGTYAKILNLPFRSLATIEDLKAALMDFQNLDVVMIDTTGRSQKDPESLKEIQDMLRVIPEIRIYLMLSSITRDTELYDAANRFSTLGPKGLIMSKLDEASTYGSIYNVSQKIKLPLIYFTTGQKIPDDIEEATRERVAALVMEI